MSSTESKAGRGAGPAEDARARYAALGERLLADFDVSLKAARTGLHGVAFVAKREIEAPWPTTTRKRLYILAHEIGHVALGHVSKLPRYVEEYEAEQFAHVLLRREGVAVPRSMTERAKRYVRRKITQAHARFVRWVDPDIAEWSGVNVKGINWSADPKHVRPYFAKAATRVRSVLGTRATGESSQ